MILVEDACIFKMESSDRTTIFSKDSDGMLTSPGQMNERKTQVIRCSYQISPPAIVYSEDNLLMESGVWKQALLMGCSNDPLISRQKRDDLVCSFLTAVRVVVGVHGDST